ncbi:ADP-heptose synthase [Salmonella enterica subsp. enterica]|nr:ADP-heptose synthase [Salmonella enterica subsp. enterica]
MKVNLPAFERAGVMVVGDVMLDRYWYGPHLPYFTGSAGARG